MATDPGFQIIVTLSPKQNNKEIAGDIKNEGTSGSWVLIRG